MDDKKPNDAPPLKLNAEPRIVVEVSKPMQEMLDELVSSGLYGTKPADAARRLIERGLEEHPLLMREETD